MDIYATNQHRTVLMNWRAWLEEWRFGSERRDPGAIVRKMVEEEFRNRIDIKDVRFQDGVLELKGSCNSIGAAHSLLCKIQKIKGIRTINNQLQIDPQW